MHGGSCARIMRFALIAVVIATAAQDALAQQWEWPDKAENLKVLPENFPPERLSAVMRGFTRALGVRCSYCHVGDEGEPLSTYDFPSDDNPKKEVARKMLEMLGDINEHLKGVEPSGPNRVNMWCHTCHRGAPKPMTLGEALTEEYLLHGTRAMLDRYVALKDRYYGRGTFDFSEGTLNNLGYEFLGRGELEPAIAIFKLNVAQFPESGNVYDSLAEAYMTGGQTELAIIYYTRSLEIDPDNTNALEKLAELREKSR